MSFTLFSFPKNVSNITIELNENRRVAGTRVEIVSCNDSPFDTK